MQQKLEPHETRPLSRAVVGAIDRMIAADNRKERQLTAHELWAMLDIAGDALEVAWKGKAGTLKSIPEEWQGVCYLQTPGGVQEAVFLSEPALYKLAFRSNKIEAERFTHWVCAEVLPALRRQGFYGRLGTRERLACSRQIAAITHQLGRTRDAMAHAVLMAELHDLCNLIGRPVPDPTRISTDPLQSSLPLPA